MKRNTQSEALEISAAPAAPGSPLQGLDSGIGKRTMRDQISDKLAYMICSGLLQIGDELPSERELANTLNCSRETVRAAIQVLATRGMVEVSQGARTRVVRAEGYALHEAVGALGALKDYDVDVVTDARRVLEVAVVRDSAARMTLPVLERLERLLQAQSGMFDDPVRFQISDQEFHQTIYRTCANPLLAQYVGDLYAYALDIRRTALRQPGTVARSYREHCSIVAALRTRDPDAAEAAICDHLDSIYRTTLQAMGRE